ncbi:hypothetical protein LTR94_029727, partial [Friedmanniomyces endolithicus]
RSAAAGRRDAAPGASLRRHAAHARDADGRRVFFAARRGPGAARGLARLGADDPVLPDAGVRLAPPVRRGRRGRGGARRIRRVLPAARGARRQLDLARRGGRRRPCGRAAPAAGGVGRGKLRLCRRAVSVPAQRRRRGDGARRAGLARADAAAGRADDHLPDRGRHHPGLCRLCRRQHPGRDPGGIAHHADPHHDRGAAVGDRHRGDGPAGAVQRPGQVGARGGGGGRYRRAVARQDRHDHGRRPAG